MEVEIKLALDPAGVGRLARHRQLAGVPSEARRMHSVYLDTPDWDLMTRGVALRVRRAGRQWLQTLKVATESVGALSRRPEWEVPLPRGHHDLGCFPPDAQALMAKLADEGLDWSTVAPVFVTDFRRKAWTLQWGESVREWALDQGEIGAITREGRQTLPLCEVEIELKSGPGEGLFDLALALAKDLPLGLEPRSKAARGYALAGAYRPLPVKSRPAGFDPAMDAGLAWARLAESDLAQAIANVPGFLAHADDIEYLHQLRVGLRRLHGTAELAAYLAPDADHPLPDWDAPLKTAMEALNAARDWDVLLHETLPPLAARLDPPLSPAFMAHLAQQHGQARLRAQETVAHPDFVRLVLQVGPALHHAEPVERPAAAWARACMDSRWALVRKRGKGYADQDGRQRHRLRIAAKRLRYGADTLAPAFKGGKAFRTRLAALQDSLGAQQDVRVAMEVLTHLNTRAPQVQFDAGRVVGLLAHQRVNSHEVGDAVWRAFVRVRPYWQQD